MTQLIEKIRESIVYAIACLRAHNDPASDESQLIEYRKTAEEQLDECVDLIDDELK